MTGKPYVVFKGIGRVPYREKTGRLSLKCTAAAAASEADQAHACRGKGFGDVGFHVIQVWCRP